LQGFGQGKLPWTLLVDDPSAASGLDTDRIAVRETPLRLGYYAGARWAETSSPGPSKPHQEPPDHPEPGVPH
jgi:ABC-type uncharacterized transport system auxiliary subunit